MKGGYQKRFLAVKYCTMRLCNFKGLGGRGKSLKNLRASHFIKGPLDRNHFKLDPSCWTVPLMRPIFNINSFLDIVETFQTVLRAYFGLCYARGLLRANQIDAKVSLSDRLFLPSLTTFIKKFSFFFYKEY